MPVKKATAAKRKTATSKEAIGKSAAAKKATPARKTTATRRSVAKGDVYECQVCGLSVVVDEACDCAEVHEIICCSQPMKEKKVKVKAAK
jgi:hypothetical protein